jgi:hypothetical protein
LRGKRHPAQELSALCARVDGPRTGPVKGLIHPLQTGLKAVDPIGQILFEGRDFSMAWQLDSL